ncbi:MAG TPA: hypothetical protein VGP72_27300 [Planctomycetota bacterium]|jgi:hypothetical protein
MHIRLAVVCCFVLAWSCAVRGAESPKRPEVWMGPPGLENGKVFRELFEKPDDWKQTRSMIDVLCYADHVLGKQFTDDELKTWFAQLKEWKLKFGLEVGAVKPWGETGEKTFNIQRKKWDRFQALGLDIYAIAMDEPLCCAREQIHKPDSYAMEETAAFIALVRKNYPQVLIGDIETYPSIAIPDHVMWIDGLQKRLAELNVRGLDFYRLDVNWICFAAQSNGTWREVRKLEMECRKRKLPFSLIYWPSGYVGFKKKNMADDTFCFSAILQQGANYAIVDGHPEQVVVQSWDDVPSRGVPDRESFTFTGTTLNFLSKFFPKAAP